MTPTDFSLHPHVPANTADEEHALPVTSYPCQFKPPRKRKESDRLIAETHFEKHTFGKERKGAVSLIEEFDPRPLKYKGTASANVPSLLTKVQGKGLCLSLLLDPSCRPLPSNDLISMCPPELPSIHNLNTTIAAFMESLKITADKIHQIERDTRDQRHSALWYWLRRYRITSSMFGEVLHRKDQAPPDSLVLKIIQQKRFTSAATEWGILHESVAIQQYINYQRAHGIHSLGLIFVSQRGKCLLQTLVEGFKVDSSMPNTLSHFLRRVSLAGKR